MSYWRAFLFAVQFLTRLPVPPRWVGEPDPVMHGRAVVFYPVVGVLIGAILLGGYKLLTLIYPALSVYLICALLLLLWVLLSGGLHLDGLADSADAWLGGHGDREKTLAIMKDPYCGPAGVMAIVLVLLLKWAALLTVLKHPAWLLLAPLLGRAGVVMLLLTTAYVRVNGLGAAAANNLPRTLAWVVLVVSIIAASVVITYAALYIAVVAFVIGSMLRQLMLQRIGGMTGDTAGALIEVIELAVLLMAAAFVPLV